MTASDLYTCERTGAGSNDFRLVPRRPIQTRDAQTVGPRFPLFRAGDSVKLPTARERGHTRDELLESMNSEKTIGLGRVWSGAGVNPELDAKIAPIRDFVSGFVLGHVVHAVDPGKVIDLGRVFLPQVEDEEVREGLGEAIDAAEEEWKKDTRCLDDACDVPPSEKTKDAMPPRNRLFGFGKATPAAQYAAALRKGRETRDQAAPARVVTAGDYAANLAAGRAKGG